MTTSNNDTDLQPTEGLVELSTFLEEKAPNQEIQVSSVIKTDFQGRAYMKQPDIQLHCTNNKCNGVRFFRCIDSHEHYVPDSDWKNVYVNYQCWNCKSNNKTFSLAIRRDNEGTDSCYIYKFGELPTYGPPIPPRLIKMIGPDHKSFLKGRRCEIQGLGIGAFVYYRRVVENQKNRILKEIVKVCEKIKVPEEDITTLQNAIKETQFTKALSMAKDAIPESLLIDGHNPILLLHGALSDGIHNLNDAECLKIASSIRMVLGELSERLSQALKDEAKLTTAISTLLNRKRNKP